MTESKPEPVRVMMYGLFGITKERYVRQIVLSVLMGVCLLVGWMMIPQPDLTLQDNPVIVDADGHPVEYSPHADRPWNKAPDDMLRLVRILNFIPWVVGVLLAFAAVEATFVLRRFAEKEAAQRAEAERKAAEEAKKAAAVSAPAPETTASAADPAASAAGAAAPAESSTS